MLIHQMRFSGGVDDTLGLLFIDGKFEAFTLEDEYREIKVPGETRIPDGVYEIKLRTEGGLHEKYSAQYPGIHKGMLHYQSVPGFTYIYLHVGNKESHTDGCPLLGDTSSQNRTRNGAVGQSGNAYRRIYPIIAGALEKGEEVYVWVGELNLSLFHAPLPERPGAKQKKPNPIRNRGGPKRDPQKGSNET